MLPDQQFLRIPGPTPIPPSVNGAMSQPMIGHRDQETNDLLHTIKPKLKPVFGTDQDVLIISGSGTAGLEAAVVNAVQPGDEVLVIVTGAFGDRFAQICTEYGIATHRIDIEWGEAIEPESIQEYLKKHPDIKAVFATFCETSTGVLNPVQEVGQVIQQHSDALFIVDGVSGIGGVNMEMDAWGIDILITGSQKALMLPPGLTFMAVSERAWNVIEKNDRPSFYFDLTKYRDQLANDSTPFTPALSLLFGLKQVLELLDQEGLETTFSRHRQMMNMTRAAFQALSIPLLTNAQAASPTVTAIKADDFDPDTLRNVLKNEFGLLTAGGQKHLKGRIFRIGHMGYCSPADILQTISIIEIALNKIGKPIELGKGTRAAQEIMLSGGS
ncbi:alanine--glyoxylate aminotransferase family protein [Lentibacillus sp. CBA3610]|uniref:pyridoxal-phosphate-dependent aminotransferase family protein n=1 Tax=Lentibacillus sp. CBA3610 TaxID=2518176 RepID=UPI00159501E4|nr:alanine--glyoxylate aminotransferase family protein [Lentibacillus sp. CBA3610]QKY68364.1 alanine--glyoxylate aminotransferase family protein [Lentibacillus sp. CBA3610]